jgi:hypothetical protein
MEQYLLSMETRAYYSSLELRGIVRNRIRHCFAKASK